MEQHSALAAYGPDGKLTLWSATQTPHYVHRAVAKVLEMAPAHVRVIACPNGGGFGGKSDPFSHELVVCKLSMKTGPAGEDHSQPRRSLLLPPRPPPGEDVGEDRPQEGRLDHRDALPLRARRRRVRQLRRGQPLLHGRAADRDLQGPALPLRRRARLHQQAALRPQARARHAAAAVRPRGAHRQVLPRPRPRPRGLAAAQHGRAGDDHRQPDAGEDHRPEGLPRAGDRAQRLSRQAREDGQRARHRHRRARPTSAAPACPSTGTRCRTPACR